MRLIIPFIEELTLCLQNNLSIFLMLWLSDLPIRGRWWHQSIYDLLVDFIFLFFGSKSNLIEVISFSPPAPVDHLGHPWWCMPLLGGLRFGCIQPHSSVCSSRDPLPCTHLPVPIQPLQDTLLQPAQPLPFFSPSFVPGPDECPPVPFVLTFCSFFPFPWASSKLFQPRMISLSSKSLEHV